MPNDTQTGSYEDAISLRSYFIWENEGRPSDKALEHWLRAKAELEAELEAAVKAAPSEEDMANFVMPRPPISTPPSRSEATKIDPKKGLRYG